jgi:sugar/nucleoside kinase (ribokinase family)
MNTSAPRIAVIGAHILDTHGAPVEYLPEGQDSLRLDQIRVTPAGTAGGTAVDLAILGAQVSSVGAVGDDEAGTFLRTLLQRRGVDTSGLVTLSGAQTSSTILLIRPNGDRPALHVVGVHALVVWDDLEVPDFDDVAAVHMGGLDALASLGHERALQIMEQARSAGTLVSMDFQSGGAWLRPSLLELLAGVDIFMPNIEQATALVGPGAPEEIASRLLAAGAGAVALTLGEDGALYMDAHRTVHHPAFAVDVVDTTGCGDAFCATFVLATVKGMSPEEALRVASAGAGLAAGALGSDGRLTSWDDLMEFARSTPLASTTQV